MKKDIYKFKSTSNICDIRVVKYLPDVKPIGILQISHGMQEFVERYEAFASFLCSKGFVVVANDHLGHGDSVNSKEDWGYFGDLNGNSYLINDLFEVTKNTKNDFPNIPYFILGHSMGSFLLRQYLCLYGNSVDGAIIMGTGHESLSTISLAMNMCKLFAMGKGWHHRSKAVSALAFGPYLKRFENDTYSRSWLTKDKEIVKWYKNEPRCNFIFTLNGYYNMFYGISRLHDSELLRNMPKDLPMFFVSGEDDPVGDYGKGVYSAIQSLKDVGCLNIDVKLYPNDRHEILNEFDKDQVYEDIYNWLEEKMKCL